MYHPPRSFKLPVLLSLITALLAGPATLAAEVTDTAPAPVASQESVSTSEILKMLRDQQAQLNAQKQLLDEQNKSISALQANYAKAKNNYDQEIAAQAVVIDDQRKTLRTMQAKVDEMSDFDPAQLTDEEIAFRSRLETLEGSIAASTDASSTSFDAESFPGSLPIPGSAAAIRIGGYVKANLIQSFDSIGSQDRFIVGTIPTDPIEQGDSEAELTVGQSRLSFDLRDNTKIGVLRGFIEGDFAATADTFRLRHAFGQLGDVLAGKTWSVFVDAEAIPEEVDFEGINGRVNVRQTQFRWFPKIGEDWNLITSLEDPSPAIANGAGISQIPDFIVSGRRDWLERWHVKTALVVRQIQGRWDADTTVKDDVTGWGLSISGKTAVPKWDPRDNLMFQFNVGKGYGRYVSDLETVGGGDAVFDANGKLFALPVLAGYVAFQKWWRDGLRSTFIASMVSIDTYDFQPANAYDRTERFSGNLIYSPTSRVDLGGELLWGRRQDKDKEDGTAFQLQLSAKYRF